MQGRICYGNIMSGDLFGRNNLKAARDGIDVKKHEKTIMFKNMRRN
jgi:hypothetical protein